MHLVEVKLTLTTMPAIIDIFKSLKPMPTNEPNLYSNWATNMNITFPVPNRVAVHANRPIESDAHQLQQKPTITFWWLDLSLQKGENGKHLGGLVRVHLKTLLSYQLQKAPCSWLEFWTSSRMRSRHTKKKRINRTLIHISKHCHHCTLAQYHTGEVLTRHCLTSMGKFFWMTLAKVLTCHTCLIFMGEVLFNVNCQFLITLIFAWFWHAKWLHGIGLIYGN